MIRERKKERYDKGRKNRRYCERKKDMIREIWKKERKKEERYDKGIWKKERYDKGNLKERKKERKIW